MQKKKKSETAAAGITSPKTKEMEWAAASKYWEGRGQEHAEFRQLETDEKKLQETLEVGSGLGLGLGLGTLTITLTIASSLTLSQIRILNPTNLITESE